MHPHLTHMVAKTRGWGRWRTWLRLLSPGASAHSPFTFLFGIVTGYYYVRERNLIPLMITHAVVDFWSFGWFLLLR